MSQPDQSRIKSIKSELVWKCVHELVTRQAVTKPNGSAVSAWDGDFSYQELDSLSTLLARRLAHEGIGPEVKVPLCFEKSKWTVVAILGTLKAGAAFVPLDPSHPIERLENTVAAVKAHVLLASARNAHLLPHTVDNVVEVSEACANQWKNQEYMAELSSYTSPSNAAYVLFTSGSTGSPKGCVVEHAAYCSSSQAHSTAMGIVAGRRVLQFASYGFDASMCEILTSLIVGACICIPSEEERVDDLSAAITRYNVDWTFLTPTAVKLIEPERVPTLRTLVVGGEASPQGLIDTWASKVELLNGYGPTETVVFATCYRFGTTSDARTLGYGIGTRCWVANFDEKRPCPVGVVGELLIESPAMARCYLDDEHKTNAAFIDFPPWLETEKEHINGVLESHSTGKETQRRLYRSGDFVQSNSDGTLHYIGRRDDQIKVRGRRIELGEIEHRISGSGLVASAAVVVRNTHHESTILVAVIVFKDDTNKPVLAGAGSTMQPPEEHQNHIILSIRQYLSQWLPEYMIPSAWIALKSLPVNLSGKLDRRQITKWVASLDDSQVRPWIADRTHEELASISPSNDVEAQLQKIWSEVLNLPIRLVNMKESFLQLGGDSISAMQVVAKCRLSDLKIGVKHVLKSPSIPDLANKVPLPSDTPVVLVDEDESRFYAPFSLSPIQKFFFDQCPGINNHFNQSFLLELSTEVTLDAVDAALTALMKRHVQLRARFTRASDGTWMQYIVPEHCSNLYRVERFSIKDEEEAMTLIKGLQSSLEIQQGPILRMDLLHLDNGKHLLFASCHHLVVDLVSWRVILQDLEDYLRKGSFLAARPLPFPVWLELQTRYSRDKLQPMETLPHDIGEPQQNFWTDPGQSNCIKDIVTNHFVLDHEVTAKLLSTACNRTLHTEPVEILVASLIFAFKTIFPERAPPTIFNEGHGREPWDKFIDLSETVGWFTTLCPLYSSVNHGSIVETVAEIKDQRRRTPKNGFAYFSSRYLHPNGQTLFGSHKDSEVIFNYEGIFQQFERVDGLFRQSPLSTPHLLNDNDPEMPRITLFEMTATIKQGQLHFTVDYHRHMKHQDRIHAWISEYQSLLETLPEQLTQMQPQLTLSDFPLLDIRQADWRKLRNDVLSNITPQVDCDIEDIYRCSASQEGMLISQSRNPNLYKVEIKGTLIPLSSSGPVDAKRLYAAWDTVVGRHPILRSVFVGNLSGDGTFGQIVLRRCTAALTLPCQIEFTQLPNGHVDIQLNINHVAADASSLGVILRDLSFAYDGRLPEKSAPPYSQFVEYCKSQPTNSSENYWLDYTRGISPCLFPTQDAPIEGVVTHSTVQVPVKDDKDLQAFCRKWGVTLSNVLHGAWAIVLQAFLGTDEVCFGYFGDGKDIALDNGEDAVGVFISTLVCRVNMQLAGSVVDLIRRVREDFINGLPHQYTCSLVEIHHALQLGGKQLFNTGISVQRDWPKSWQSHSSSLASVKWHETNDFAISINAIETAANVDLTIGFDAKNIPERQIHSIAATFEHVIAEIVRSEADRQIADIGLLGMSDLKKIQQWNGKPLPPMNNCIHDLIKAQASRTPDAIAISSWDGDMTYAELIEVSDLLARYIVCSYRLSLGEYVLLCFDKSRWTIPSMLAVMMAGGAFVPLEPSHPLDRLKSIAIATKARIALTSPQFKEKLVGLVYEVVPIEPQMMSHLPALKLQAVCPTIAPDQVAYVLFTSGSTGKPKGCMIQHRAWCSSGMRQAHGLQIQGAKRVLQFANYSFGASLIEMLSPLFLGATVCVVSSHDRENNLEAVITNIEVDFAVLPPSLLHTLQSLSSVKTLVCGGETLEPSEIQRWADRLCLISGYGSSEGSVVTTAKIMSKTSYNKDIGHAFNGSCWIVNASNYHQLLPIGAVGELLIEGPHLALGYLNEPEKTAEVFVNDASWMQVFCDRGRRRFYRTGDLVRYNPEDGSITYVGRKDTQVKINGVRIELEEIEHQLKKFLHDIGAVAVVVVFLLHGSQNRLVAFFALEEGIGHVEECQIIESGPNAQTFMSKVRSMRQKLREKLPEYMVPTSYIPLKMLPMTASAKLDRIKLRNFGQTLSVQDLVSWWCGETRERIASTEMELRLQTQWMELLSLEDIGIDDDFFRLGGDSLVAMRLVARARDVNISITVADVFKHPTLSELAKVVKPHGLSGFVKVPPFALVDKNKIGVCHAAAMQCNIESGAIEDIYPCTALQEGMMALSNKYTGSHVAHLIIDMPTDMDLSRFQHAVHTLVQQNPILRSRLVQNENFHTSTDFLQVVVNEPAFVNSVGSLASYLSDAKGKSPELGQPLSRFVLAPDNERSVKVLVWSIHHALYDGWSLPLMLEDLARAYDGHEAHGARLPFSSFVNYLVHKDNAGSHDFWRSYLEHTAGRALPPIPTPGYSPSHSAEIKKRIDISFNNMSTTLPTLIKSAWGLTCCAYTGSNDAVFGLTLNGRDSPVFGIENVVGPTISTVPFRVNFDPKGNEAARTLLKRIQIQGIEMIPHQHYGIRNIRKVNDVTLKACDFTNLLVIHPQSDDLYPETTFRLRKDESTDLAVFTTYPLIVQCTLEEQGFTVTANYDHTVLPTDKIIRILRHFEYVLSELGHDDDREISKMVSVSPADFSDLKAWNTHLPAIIDCCIHDLIKAQSCLSPEAEAVCAWDGSLSYCQLETLSSRLANYLIDLGVGPEVMVPVCVDKSKWQVVSILGVLKAGGTFVPVDPTHPPRRIRQIASIVDANVVVISRPHQSIFSDVHNIVEVGDASFNDIATASYPVSQVKPHHSAYVLFTSGSTGVPKGCVIEHSAFCSAATYQLDGIGLTGATRVLNFASLSFDASMGEILTSLRFGRTVCVISEHDRLNRLPAAIAELRADWAFFTPSLLSTIDPRSVPTLKTICCGGEPIDRKHIETWSQHLNFISVYGPTECTVICCSNPSISQSNSPRNIGRPFSCRFWITHPDDVHALVPLGAVGELLIEGPVLARSYLGDKARTVSAFVQSPRWAPTDESGKPRRLYRTGDLVFQETDGSVVYVGRLDNQVKVRGQRCEIEEIESCILEVVGVHETVVLMDKTYGRSQQLVAALTMTDAAVGSRTDQINRIQPLDEKEHALSAHIVPSVRQHLFDTLPAFMVPTYFIVLDQIPLTIGGKLDRAKVKDYLSNLTEDQFRASKEFSEVDVVTEPVNSLETKLRKIWANVLNIPEGRISTTDSFLRIGGDSISAMQVMARCRLKGLTTVTVQDILQSRDISRLAARLVEKQAREAKNIVGGIELEKENVIFDLSPVQRLFFDLSPKGENHFNQSTLLQLEQHVTWQSLVKALEHIVKRHPMLRARFVLDQNDRWKQIIVPSDLAVTCFNVYDLNDKYEIVPIAASTELKINIRDGPVFAADLFNVQDDQYLFLSAHHLVIDLVSWRIILYDLEESILRNCFNNSPILGFGSWIEELSAHLQSTTLPVVRDSDLEERGCFDFLPFWDIDIDDNCFKDVKTQSITLSAQVTEKLLGTSNAAYRTEPRDILIAAILTSFEIEFAERDAPQFFVEGHGRQTWNAAVDPSETVGWFTKFYAMGLSRRGTPVLNAVRMIKDQRVRQSIDDWDLLSLRYPRSSDDPSLESRGTKPVEISFNYMGRFQQMERQDALFRPVSSRDTDLETRLRSKARSINPSMRRFAVFDISVSLQGREMQLNFAVPQHAKHMDRISNWINKCEQAVTNIVTELCQKPWTPTLTDFPLLQLTYEQLDVLISVALPQAAFTDPSDLEDAYPCSASQKGMFVAQLKDPSHYLVTIVQEVIPTRPHLTADPEKLAAAWQKVIDRHQVFRTIFVENMLKDGEPGQIVLKKVTPKIEYVQTENDNDGDIEESLKGHGIPPDDSTEAGGLRLPYHLAIISTPNGLLFFRLIISHALLDAFSVPLILNELSLAYENNLPTIPGPLYSSFISYVQTKQSSEADEYWSRYLEGVTPCNVPGSLSPQEHNSPQTTAVALEFEVEEAPEILAFCRKVGITLSTIFQTAWALLLRKYTGNDDVCFSYMSSGRDIPLDRVEEAIGPYITLLITRVRMDGTSFVADLMNKMQNDHFDSLPYQHSSSLAEIQQSIKLHGQSLFNTGLSFNRIISTGNSRGSSLRFVDKAHDQMTEYAIAVNANEVDDNVRVRLTYERRKMSDNFMSGVAATFRQALTSITRCDSSHRVSEMDLFGEHHRQLIWAWNAACWPPVFACVHTLFEEQASMHPQKIAVSSWDGQLNYRELNILANSLASSLIQLGARSGSFIPLTFEKSIWAIVAMLGVMKSGAAFVPLSPSQPAERLRSLAAAVNASIAISSPQYYGLLAATVHTVIQLDKSSILNEVHLSTSVDSNVRPEDPVYLIFTSGSTGMPKGVVMEHRAFCSSATYHSAAMAVKHESRVLQFASFAFNACMAEILTTLTLGATVCVPSDEEKMNDPVAAINRLQVTVAFLTSSFVRTIRPEDVPRLKTLVLAGEPASQRDVDEWFGKVQLIIGYGQTESAVCCSSYEIVDALADPRTIGRGVGATLWIAEQDDCQRLCPIGTIGELLVEGPGLGKKYLNDEIKTAAAFIEDPKFLGTTKTRRRFYRTGDLVRQQLDGNIIYVGRRDTQVKRNGQRIELGEIEQHLYRAIPWAKAVIAELVSSKREENQTILVAFIYFPDSVEEMSDGDSILNDTCRSRLRSMTVGVRTKLLATMPEYMVPSHLFPIWTIPLVNGAKIDREKLRRLAQDMPLDVLTSHSFEANETKRTPNTPTEATLQSLWAKALNVLPECIGIDDSFHGLGGDSVVAMRLVSFARAAGLPISVADVFDHPILTDLASSLDSKQDRPSWMTAVPLQHKTELPSLAEDRLAYLARDLVNLNGNIDHANVEAVVEATDMQASMIVSSLRRHRGEMNCFILDFDAAIDTCRLRSACERLIEHNSILRTVFIAYREQMYQVVLRSVPINFVFYDMVDDVEQSSSEWIEASRKSPVVLGENLVQFRLFGNAELRSRLVIELSHTQYDGISYGILIQDLQSGYLGQELLRRPQMFDLIHHMKRQRMEDAKTHFRAMLQDSTVTLLRPSALRDFELVTMDKTVTETITYCKPTIEGGSTFATVLKAAWASVLAGVTGIQDVVFGQIVSGRNLNFPHVDQVLGCCINNVPVRVKFHPTERRSEILREIQQQHLAGVPFETLGTEELIKQCTTWSPRSRLSTVVHHLNIGSPEADFPFCDNVRCRISFSGPPNDSADIAVVSTFTSDAAVKLSLTFSEHLITLHYAEELLRLLSQQIISFMSNPEGFVELDHISIDRKVLQMTDS